LLIYQAVLESKTLYILGYSGHALVTIDAALSMNYEVKGYFDKNKASINPYNIEFLGSEREVNINDIVKTDAIFPAVGSNAIRRKLIKFIETNKLKQLTVTDASALISSKAIIGKSTLIGAGVIINSMVHIGQGSIINTGSIIEHECKIGSFTHIAPGAVLAGEVLVGDNVFIGANATVKQGITIGDNVIVGAGSVVLKDISDGETWIGNPARKLR